MQYLNCPDPESRSTGSSRLLLQTLRSSNGWIRLCVPWRAAQGYNADVNRIFLSLSILGAPYI